MSTQSKSRKTSNGHKSTSRAGRSKYENLDKSPANTNRVSLCELFRFATFADRLLIIIGALFAVLEGMGSAIMALVFGGMTETLISTIKTGFAPSIEEAAPTTSTTTAAAILATTIATTQAPNLVNNATIPVTLQVQDATTNNNTSNNFINLSPLTREQFEYEIARYSIFYVFIGVAVYMSSWINITCWQTACERQTHKIRRRFFSSIMRQELSWFDTNRAGELSSKFNDDIERIRDGMGEQFSSIIKYTSSFGAGFLVGFIVSWRLTLVILAATPLLALFSAYLGRMLSTSTKREQERYATAGALAEEVLVAVRTVIALGGQWGEIKNYQRVLEESRVMALWKYFKLSVVLGLSMMVLYATYGLALFVATDLLSVNMISAGQAMTVIMAVMMGASALGNVIPPLQTIVMSMSSASLIYEIIDSIPRIDAFNDRGLKLSKVTANIKFENVTFSYPLRPQVPVLKSLNFELQQGQTVAICGRTGSGKSTIMNLLLRFYDPQDGAIYLDNCNLLDLNVAWLRSLTGIVEQEPALFDCTIFENIALGSAGSQVDLSAPSATGGSGDKSRERVIEAAKLANAHEFIVQLPEGYNTRCGDRGVQMSGGQKQRIAIARALLSDPKILLLDEATSALDSESEFMVQSALNRARQGRTTIIIAHRLSTIREADLICVMENGQIVESGQHDELMALKSVYYNLVTNQVFTDQRLGDVDVDDDDDDDGLIDDESGASENPNELDSDSSARIFSDAQQQQQQQLKQARQRSRSKSTATNETARKRSDTFESSRSFSKLRHSPTLYESIHGPMNSLAEYKNGNSQELLMPTYRDLFKLVKPEINWITAGIVAAMVSGVLLPVFALFYAQIFDTFSKTGDELLDSGKFWSIMFVVLAVAMFLTMSMRVFLMAMAVEKLMCRLRGECFTNILRQHVGWFDSAQNSPQRLTTRLASDVPQLKAIINARFSSLISGVATIFAALFVAFYLGWKLAILLTVALPLLLYTGYLQMRFTRGDRAKHIRQLENASRLATEAIEHVKLIQAINKERHFFDKFNQELRHPIKDSLRSARRFGLIYGLSQSIIYFIYGAAFRYGGHLIAKQELDPITVFRIFFSVAFTAVAVGQWGGFSGDLSRANYSIALLIKQLRTQPSIDNLSRGGIKPRLRGQVTFQDVYFRYPTRPDTPVLQSLNLTIKPGQTLALVGPSGNGKSTIGSLLLRFYDPDRGVVRIDDYDIRCINLNNLRLNVGIVSQEPCLFKSSIKDNIVYGLDKSRYRMSDVEKAAKLANIHDFIMSLPDGYDTQVGERGTQMSGGQKQRIAIARTMIRNPTVLILDEATSALDAESESLVNEALEEASKGKTCIKIAHRLSTVRDADQIAVIDHGTVIELGTHDELMSLGKKGYYYRLMQKQEISS